MDMPNEFEMARKRLALNELNKLEKLTLDELEEKIKERLALLQTIIDFVANISLEIGSIIRYKERSCNTRVVREIENFAGFYIYWSTGETQWGGDTIGIKNAENNEVIFHLRYSGGKLSEVSDVWEITIYDEDLLREKFLKLIDDKDEIIKKINKSKNKEKLEREKRENNEAKRKKLEKDAKKIGL